MLQTWHDLLFMHWPVPAGELRDRTPEALAIDTFDGSAWVSIVPFHMTGIRARRLPAIPGTSAFAELNVRTYVTLDGKPGVWFFSLDAANALAVAAARRFYHLPYYRAQMRFVLRDRGEIDYRSRRTHRGAPPADLRVIYRPTGDLFGARPGSLDYFLAERYLLYAADGADLFRCEIDHAPWRLRTAEAQIRTNTMAAASGIVLPNQKPLLRFAERQEVRIWGVDRR